ncbi:hypothetical protein D1007_28835 [Hordeum vulgare]|nr:hypothetical protein D1007_28835 [Hordeum vulgare]
MGVGVRACVVWNCQPWRAQIAVPTYWFVDGSRRERAERVVRARGAAEPGGVVVRRERVVGRGGPEYKDHRGLVVTSVDGGDRGGDQLMLTMAQWRARERCGRGGSRDDDDDRSVAASTRGNRRGRCYHCNERGHFKRECLRREKPAPQEQAMLGEVDDDEPGLL